MQILGLGNVCFLENPSKPDRYAVLEGGAYAPCPGRKLMSKSNFLAASARLLEQKEERKPPRFWRRGGNYYLRKEYLNLKD